MISLLDTLGPAIGGLPGSGKASWSALFSSTFRLKVRVERLLRSPSIKPLRGRSRPACCSRWP